MLERHTQKGINLSWLEGCYKPEEKTLIGYKVEWMKNIKKISVADRTKKGFFSRKTIAGCDALWLPYTPGAINYTNSSGRDVISGPFSGCIMAAYVTGGGRRVCHVSTEAEGHRNDCKELWGKIKENCTSYIEFKPHDVYRQFSNKKLRKFGNVVIFGIITADNNCFSLIVDRTAGIITAKSITKMQPTDQR